MAEIDLSKIAALVAKVEGQLASNGGDTNSDKKINTEAEESVFAAELKKMVDKNELSAKDAAQIWGLEKSQAVSQQKESSAIKGQSIDVNDGDSVVININLTTNVNINLTVEADFKSAIQDLIDGQNDAINKLVDFFKKYLEEHSEYTDIEFLEEFIKNILLQVVGNIDLSKIEGILNDILDRLGETNAKIDKLQEKIIQMAEDNLKFYNSFNLKTDYIISGIQNISENQDEQIVMLNAVMNVLNSLCENVGEFQSNTVVLLNNILTQIQKGQMSMQEFMEVMRAIEANTAENAATSNEILKAVSEGNETSKQILDILKLMNSELQGLSNEVKAGMLAIVTQLAEQGTSLDDIKKLLEGIKQDTSENNRLSLLIFEAIKNLGVEVTASLSQILEAIQAQGGSGTGGDNPVIIGLLEEILAQLQQNGEENKEGFRAVLDAISTLGVNVAGQMTEILQAINAQGDNSEAIKTILEQILAQAQQNGAENQENFEKVLDAIANLKADNVTAIGDLHVLLDEIKNLLGDNNEKLDNIITNQNTITLILQSFRQEVNDNLAEFGEDGKGILERLDAILQKLDNNQCDCNVDGDALMKMLQDILEAIENHKCECNCNQGGNNEGILSDLSNVLLAPRHNPTGIDNTMADNTNAKDGTKFIDPKTHQVLIRKNGKVYDLQGKEVN